LFIGFVSPYCNSEALSDAHKELAETENEARKLVTMFNRQRDAMRELKQHAEQHAPLVDAEGNELPLKAQLDALPVKSVAETEAAMEEAKAKINGIDANPEVIRQYHERKKEIEIIRAQLSELTQSKDSKISDLEKKRLPWEQALENAVVKVNHLFEQYMAELGCAGKCWFKRLYAFNLRSRLTLDFFLYTVYR
jgi:chromosome segregation ATPase